jgi:ADP-ribose pyrophosphatase YjhB (NUDIX family)
MAKRPEIGVGIIIQKDDLILLGKRIHKKSPNAWCIPAGHVEFF